MDKQKENILKQIEKAEQSVRNLEKQKAKTPPVVYYETMESFRTELLGLHRELSALMQH